MPTPNRPVPSGNQIWALLVKSFVQVMRVREMLKLIWLFSTWMLIDVAVQWWNHICLHLKRWRQVWQLDRTEEGGGGQRETPLKIKKKLDKLKLKYREWIQIWWTFRFLGSFPHTWIEQSKNNSDQLSSRSNTWECMKLDTIKNYFSISAIGLRN